MEEGPGLDGGGAGPFFPTFLIGIIYLILLLLLFFHFIIIFHDIYIFCT